MYEMSAWRRQSPAAYKNHRCTTVSNVRPARSDERVPRPTQKFAFHQSFGRPTRGLRDDPENLHFTTVLGVRRSLFALRGCFGNLKNLRFTTVLGVRRSLFALRGCFGNVKNLRFTTVLGVQRSLFAVRVASAMSKICISPQFWASDEHEVTRGLSPAATYQTYPAEKKRRNFKEEQHFKRSSIFEEQPFLAAFLSSLSQQPFSAAFSSSLS